MESITRSGILAMAALAACVSGCSFLSVTRYSQEKLEPSQSIEVFHKYPDRPHTEIGRMSVRSNEFRDEERILIKEAQKMGADGIVFLPENAAVLSVDQVAVAIKWKAEK